MRIPFEGRSPHVHPTAWIAPGAVVIGDVEIDAGVGIWFNAVVRGDIERVAIGPRTNIQDHVTIHVTAGGYPTTIGADVTVGHAAVVHGCRVEDGCLVGMGAIVMDGAIIRERSLVAAGSLVSPGTVIPAGMLALGRPARPVRPLTADELAGLSASAERYVTLAARHRDGVGH